MTDFKIEVRHNLNIQLKWNKKLILMESQPGGNERLKFLIVDKIFIMNQSFVVIVETKQFFFGAERTQYSLKI